MKLSRRDFLKLATVGALGIVIKPQPKPHSEIAKLSFKITATPSQRS